MTSMTSRIVGKKIRAMGPGPLESSPFVVLAIKFCIFLKLTERTFKEEYKATILGSCSYFL